MTLYENQAFLCLLTLMKTRQNLNCDGGKTGLIPAGPSTKFKT